MNDLKANATRKPEIIRIGVARRAAPSANAPGDPRNLFDKQSVHASKSEAILLAAARAFVKDGFHMTSLQDIADSLGISKPTLCYYVGAKEEILFKCSHTALEHLKLTLPSRADAQRARSGLEELTEFMVSLGEWTGSEFARCLVRCQYDLRDPVSLAQVARERKLIESAVQAIIRRGLEDGSIRSVHPEMVAAAILGSLLWIATWFDQQRTTRTPHDVGAMFADFFVGGLQPRAASATAARRADVRKPPRV